MTREQALAEMTEKLHRLEAEQAAAGGSWDEDDYRINADMMMELEFAIEQIEDEIYG